MKINWQKCVNCAIVGMAVIVISALAYAINLGMKQQENLVRMDKAADRIMVNIQLLEKERDALEKEKREFKALEDKTMEDMNGI